MYVGGTHILGEKLASIESSCVNQDGRSNGLTAPNGRAQTNLIKDSLGKNLDKYVMHSSHGTGTELGDPIEVNALRKVFNTSLHGGKVKLHLNSSKSIVGHTEGSAGLTGLLLCIHGGLQMVDSEVANLRHPNQYVVSSMGDNLARISRQPSPLVVDKYLVTFGTSSFGMGG